MALVGLTDIFEILEPVLLSAADHITVIPAAHGC
jgi:hypothetical protein